jgi:hypothetical protein
VDKAFTTESLIFSGTTTGLSDLKVVSITPVFADRAHRRDYLRVDATVEEFDNAAEWSVSIENRNFKSTSKNTLVEVIISFISSDSRTLKNAEQSYSYIVGF